MQGDIMDYYPGSVTLPLEDYEEMKSELQNQDPMTRQERIDSTVHAFAVSMAVGVAFTAAAGTYYWIKDRYELRQFQRKLKDEGQAPIETIPPQR
jgi:hypothetical protein